MAKVTAKYMGRNNYEITVGKEKEVVHVKKDQLKFSRNVNETVESFLIKGRHVTGRDIATAIQKITTKKIPDYIF